MCLILHPRSHFIAAASILLMFFSYLEMKGAREVFKNCIIIFSQETVFSGCSCSIVSNKFLLPFILPLSFNSALKVCTEQCVFLSWSHILYPDFIVYLTALFFSLEDGRIIFHSNRSFDIQLGSVNKLYMAILF